MVHEVPMIILAGRRTLYKTMQKTYKRAASDECILRVRKEARARTLSLLIISKSREHMV
jgi:hypothetical protein